METISLSYEDQVALKRLVTLGKYLLQDAAPLKTIHAFEKLAREGFATAKRSRNGRWFEISATGRAVCAELAK